MGSGWEMIGKKDVCIFWKRLVLSAFLLSFLFPIRKELRLQSQDSCSFFFSPGEVRCESPNNKLDRFTGILMYKGKNYILNHDRLILRGCVIRNTDWCYGLVIFTGASFWSHRPPACWIPFTATLWILSFHDVDMMLRYILWTPMALRKGGREMDRWVEEFKKNFFLREKKNDFFPKYWAASISALPLIVEGFVFQGHRTFMSLSNHIWTQDKVYT